MKLIELMVIYQLLSQVTQEKIEAQKRKLNGIFLALKNHKETQPNLHTCLLLTIRTGNWVLELVSTEYEWRESAGEDTVSGVGNRD